MSVKAKIMVVEDNIDEAKLIKMTLEPEGYEVITALNGKEAKEKGGPPPGDEGGKESGKEGGKESREQRACQSQVSKEKTTSLLRGQRRVFRAAPNGRPLPSGGAGDPIVKVLQCFSRDVGDRDKTHGRGQW